MEPDLTERAVALAAKHHEAWALETLGDASGVSPEIAASLVAEGFLAASDTRGRMVPGMRHPVDPWMFAILTGTIIGHADPAMVHVMRTWPMERWTREVDALIDERIQSELSKGLSDWLKAAKQGVSKLLARVRPRKAYLTPQEASTHEAVTTRVGAQITRFSTANAASVRDHVRKAVEQGLTPSQLMMKLSWAFRSQQRDWLRVARTEMQAAHNEAAAAAALDQDGVTALVARVPEHDACDDCKRLYLDGEGRPRVWSLTTLVDNGTNAGRKRGEWLATLYPLHPNCRCSLVRVPAGHKFDASWKLVAA